MSWGSPELTEADETKDQDWTNSAERSEQQSLLGTTVGCDPRGKTLAPEGGPGLHGAVPTKCRNRPLTFLLALSTLLACGGPTTPPPDPPDNPLIRVVPLRPAHHLTELPLFYSATEAGEEDAFTAHTTSVAYDPADRWLDDFSGGFAVFDCDGDEDPDILFSDGQGANSLWLNDGAGGFTESTSAGVAFPGEFSVSVSAADIDKDGDSDVFLMNQHVNNRLLINDGNCHFEDRTADYGLEDENRSLHATWVDLDRNGWLDLYLTNWGNARSEDQAGEPADVQPDRLWMQDSQGTFHEASEQLPSDNLAAFGMVTGFLDWDEDGDLDMFQTNDRGAFFIPNRLYRNDSTSAGGELLFTDVTEEIGFDLEFDGMGLAFGDIDGDGDVDIFNSGSMEGLFINHDGVFVESAIASGLNAGGSTILSWGGSFFDPDADGDPDLTYVDSFFLDDGIKHQDESMGLPWFFENRFDHGQGFVAGEFAGDFSTLGLWRTSLAIDMNGDGFEDILANRVLETPMLFRTNPPAARQVVQVRLHGTASNSEGRGATVRLHTGTGLQVRWPGAVDPYTVGGPTWMTFGLDEADSAGPLEILWPSGRTQLIKSVPAGHVVHVTEPTD